MSRGLVVSLCVAPTAGAPMTSLREVMAFEGQGLEGDRYCTAEGSFNGGRLGARQVTLMNARFFSGSGFKFHESRRNIFTQGVELMWLIGRQFQIGEAVFLGERYCDPCLRPGILLGRDLNFKEAFEDRGGLIASVVRGGMIRVGDPIIPPDKGY